MTHIPTRQLPARELIARNTLTQAELRSLFDYNPDTGAFKLLKSASRSDKIGKSVGAIDKKGYRNIRVFDKTYKAHRLAWFYMLGVWPACQIDHINGARDDNRWCNLREANQSENSQNQGGAKRTNKIGLMGVRFHTSTKKFEARITKDGLTHRLGHYPTPEQAHAAYIAAKKDLHTHNERMVSDGKPRSD